MATYSVTINERNCPGVELVMRLSNMTGIKFEKMSTKKTRKSSLDRSPDDIKAGRVFEAKDGSDSVRQHPE